MLSRRQKRAIVGIAAFGLLATVILFSIGRYFSGRALQRQLAEERENLRAPEPLIVPVVRETVERKRVFSARAEPWTRATLAPEVAGTVVRLAGQVGARVAADAELLALDDRAARATSAAAAVQAEDARRRHAEITRLAQTSVVAPTELATAGALAEASTQEAVRAATMLEKHFLRAPFAGTIQARQVDVGDYLGAGQPAFELVDVTRLRVVFHVGETEIASFVPDAPVEVALPALNGRHLTAIVRHVSPASASGGVFRVEAELANPAGEIPGGLSATVTAPVRLYRDTLFIPTSAVRLEGAHATVQRHRNPAPPETVSVEIGPEIEGRFPVHSGLNEGDRLIVR